MSDSRFDDIRPFNGAEFPEAMRRITSHELFPAIAAWLFPGRNLEELRSLMCSLRDADEFQARVMRDVVQSILDKTSTGLSWSGLEGLSRQERYLFVSNHRDIMLDAAIQQYLFVNEGFHTAEISFGANLMSPGLVTDIGRANKMYRTERPGVGGASPRELWKALRHLSDYIRYTVCEKRQSVWIAQRGGRTKDGRDATDPGVLKMFLLSAEGDLVDAMLSLHLAPVAVSYEWEPCDTLKVLELYRSSRSVYVKQPGEDLHSILTGITQPKGRIHMAFCPPVTHADLAPYRGLPVNAFCREVAALLDRRIRGAYKLFPNHYIAADLLSGSSAYAAYYTDTERQAFLDSMVRLDALCAPGPECAESLPSGALPELRERYLRLYANPVFLIHQP
ncbi:MAG: acyltransferase [Bacteroidales bacterium]|nr:acyltransferase [Bacteroidales bacterium]